MVTDMRHSCGQVLVFAGVSSAGEQVFACTESRAHAFLHEVFFDSNGQQLQSVRWAKRKRTGDVELTQGAQASGYLAPLTVSTTPSSFAAKVWAMEQRIGRRVEAYRRMPKPRWRTA